MPEGDTIYRTARALQKALGGKVVTGFEANVATLASVDDDKGIVGRTVESVEARGKWCLIHFSKGPLAHQAEPLILLTHMLMSGSWHIYRTALGNNGVAEKWWMPRSKMRCAVTCGDFVAVAFNVQTTEFHTERTLLRYSLVPKLGVDVLSEEYSVEAGVAALKGRAASHPDDEVAVVLLNQGVLAGLGNVYKSEVAFAAGVNPFRAMRTLTEREIETMAEVSQRWMKANVNESMGPRGESGDGIVTYTGPRRTTHSMTQSDRTWVYGRQGQECRRCGALIQMRKQGAAVRSTYWCPSCQPWVAADGQSEEAPVGRQVKILGGRRRVGC